MAIMGERIEVVNGSEEYILEGDLSSIPIEKATFWEKIKIFLFRKKRIIEIFYSVIEGDINIISLDDSVVFKFVNLRHVKGNLNVSLNQEFILPLSLKCDKHMSFSETAKVTFFNNHQGWKYSQYHGMLKKEGVLI